jgi:serine/arginine repetitive matrix protein 2
VVDSIESSRTPTTSPSPEESKKLSISEIEFSSSIRRHKDLADALFGPQETERKHSSPNPSISLPPATPPTAVSPILDQSPPVVLPLRATSTPLSRERSQSQQPKSAPPVTGQKPSLTKISKATEADIAREIVRKTEAAMAELGKNPESLASQDSLRVGPLAGRKRINPSQISQPRFVSASTSVDAIPLQSTAQPPKKMSDRLKKIRETLRSKHPSGPNGDEVTPYPLSIEPAASGFVRRGSGSSALARTESGGSRVSLTNPPASAAPSLKGFLGRWRRPRTANGPPDADHRPSPLSQSDPPSASNSQPYPRSSSEQLQSAPPTTRAFNSDISRRTLATDAGYGDENSQTETEDTVARKRFLDAASSLGLDEDAVQDLLSRRGSSRNNPNPFVARPLAIGRSNSARLPVGNGNGSLSSVNARSQYIAESHLIERPNGRPGSEGDSARNDEAAVGKKPPMRRRVDPQDGNSGETTIVRRTLIFPSEPTSTIDLNFLRKGSQAKRRRSGSGGSLRSSRSVHDRAPTPPPPRSPTSARFSRDSPPVPKLPPTFASHAENMLQVPISAPSPVPIEKTSSTYDSLYV